MRFQDSIAKIRAGMQAAGKTPACPSEEEWPQIATGLTPDAKAGPLIEHAARCGHCGPLLREAMEDMAEPDAQASAEIDAVATPAWQRALAQRMEAVSAPVAPARVESRSGWLDWLRLPAWGYAVAAAAVIVTVTGLVWFRTRETDLQKTERLLAQAYTEQRILDTRFGDAPYSPKRVQRGGSLDEPAELSEAKAKATTGLKEHPEDPVWLAARARVDLLEGDYEKAIERFRRSLGIEPDSASLQADLASAYFLRAQSLDRPIDYAAAYELWSQALAKRPDDQAILYNHALAAEKNFAIQTAMEDWNHYLKLDSKSGWADEARKHLQSLQNMPKGRKERAPVLFYNPEDFSSHFDAGRADQSIEAYLDIAVRKWLPLAYSEAADAPVARKSLIQLAKLAAQKHNDTWLRELLATGQSKEMNAAIGVLGKAIVENARGKSAEAAGDAKRAQRLFTQARSAPGRLRSNLEHVYALQRSMDARHCQEELGPLQKELARHAFLWASSQAAMEQYVCAMYLNDKARAGQAIEFATALARDANYGTQTLRALGFRGDLAAFRGDFPAAWVVGVNGLQRFWAGSVPAIRGFQFYSDMLIISETQQWNHLGVAVAREDAMLAAEMEDRLQEPLTRVRLAALAQAAGKPDLAAAELLRSEELYRRVDSNVVTEKYRAYGDLEWARLELSRNLDQRAILRLDHVREILPSIGTYLLPLGYYRTLGELEMKQGRRHEAEEALQAAAQEAEHGLLTLRSDRERIVWTHESDSVYRALVQLRWQQGDVAGAWELWEWYRAAPLRSASRRQAPKYRSLLESLNRETVLSYALLQDGLAIWVADSRGVEGRWRAGATDRVSRLSRRFSEDCSRPDSEPRVLEQLGRDLYAELVAPVADLLPTDHVLVIEPDDALSEVPFQALVVPSGSYLSDQFALLTSPGMSYRECLRPSRVLSAKEPALVVGVSQATSLRNLPDAIEEARAVAGAFVHAVSLSDQEASIQRLDEELPQAAIFHFAGHARSDLAGTGLILNRGDTTLFGVEHLTAHQLRHCQLAVLSACATDRGEQEGLYDPDSLVRAFLASGVPHVIASRWNVDSAAAAAFMKLFYQALFSGHDIPAGLRLAAAELRKSQGLSHPYYWATFNGFGKS
jgi:CHAT domain-containing protein